ncbi:MAG: HepT-like ribonuclease domain-containing protein [Campylobacterota bacterium]|nr:HepT-like ribonuclease domain-containing protein [Campylobacterota bacterium]
MYNGVTLQERGQKNLIHIFTILECCEKAWLYTKDFDNPRDFIWANEQKELNATISLFIAIGEESKKIDKSLKDAVILDLSWSDIAGLRDKISHDYRGVDGDILWIVIHKDLHKLKTALVDMIHLINPNKELLTEFLNTPYYKHLQYLL